MKVVHFGRSGRFGRVPFHLTKLLFPLLNKAPLYPACKNNKQTRGGLARVCANGM